jgi:phosphoribosylaminoimidazolecarboxamide formyltransferase/IMP cyclohydrolase
MVYEKVTWNLHGQVQGLRYGENPGQPAALYKPINGNLVLGDCETILPGRYLLSDMELLQSGKHPGKTNITDIDNALNILRYFSSTPTTVIVKHNNPCGVAGDSELASSYHKALMADRIAAFGGAVACNRTIDGETADLISRGYIEVLAAPSFENKALDILSKKKNLRIIKIENINRLHEFIGTRYLDIKSLIDGAMILQTSFSPETLSYDDMKQATAEWEGQVYRVEREPTGDEYADMLFGWLVETGITSNSIIYVKDGVTVGIGTGEQDRVGVAEIARDKAYKKMADRVSYEWYETPYGQLEDEKQRKEIDSYVNEYRGGLKGSTMVSDAFFPFRDGIEVGLREGVTAVIQPGGAIRDVESIQACNEYGAAMVFTGQRCFKH